MLAGHRVHTLIALCQRGTYCAPVTQTPVGPTAAIARQMRELRRAQGLSGQKLADAMTAEGVAWDRSIVANLETGRRRTVSVEEWLALARVLGVAPLHLLVPIEGGEYQVTPSLTADAEDVRTWVSGYDSPLTGVGDDRDRTSWFERHRPPDRHGDALEELEVWRRRIENTLHRLTKNQPDQLGDADGGR